MVLCCSMFTCHDYVLPWLVCKFLSETGFAFCFDICQIIDRCSPNCSKNGNGKIYSEIHVAQVCLWLAGAWQNMGLMTGFRVCLKDLNIIERRLLNMILNGSLLKRFRFLDEFSSLTLRFTITWSFIDVIWCAPQSNKSLRTMRNEIVYIPVRKHWSGRR